MGQRDQDYVLSGIVELDDAYFGAPKSNGKRGRGTEKTSALAAVSLTEQGHPRFLKIQGNPAQNKKSKKSGNMIKWEDEKGNEPIRPDG